MKAWLDLACITCSGVSFVAYIMTNDQTWANIALFNGVAPLWGKK